MIPIRLRSMNMDPELHSDERTGISKNLLDGLAPIKLRFMNISSVGTTYHEI